ncbi:TonB-dependent receptor [Ideonella sp.]|uniref:TonB-dependent receptor n=1 Tax=Ideonella sp. TaxID=1929293 RepID=UPI003BB5CE3C
MARTAPLSRSTRTLRPALLARFPASACAQAAWLALTALTPAVALAQTTPPAAEPQRIEITGSAIKRIDGETALPVQVITREEIDKAGLTTAAEIVGRMSASANNLTDGVSIGTGGFRDQMGFNSANLRGMGTSSTLVLLNGRRMANFASPGDDSGVDLNNIPAAAIDRVEVLLDGASAIYGSDAIGGVINFITRRDYQGVDLSAYAGITGEGGASKKKASISAGFGSFNKDGFNLFGVLDAQKTGSLRTSQRKFISDLKIPERLPHLLSGVPNPANIRLSGDQRDYLQSVNFEIGGKPIETRTINLSAPGCNPPHSLYLPDGIGGEDACTYDYMRDLELYPKSDKVSAFGRGVVDLGSGHQAFAELSLTRAKSYYVGTSNRVNALMDVSLIPELAATGLASVDPEMLVRLRLLEAGQRTSELTSTGQRFVTGLTGVLAGWDYDLGLNHSTSKVSDRDVQGYLNQTMVEEGIADGRINPFGPSSAAGLTLLEQAQIREEVRRATGTMDSIDVRASKPLMALTGGDLALALGAEFRRETQKYHQSDLLAADLILGEVSQGAAADFSNSRKVAAAFAELSAPLTKQLELQLALRHEHYEVTGGATSPKIGLRYTASKELMLRASAGSGFRAPSLTDLYRPITGGTSATLPDPVCMAENDNDLTYCADLWETRTYSNPALKPERSRQFSFGAVFEPSSKWSLSADFWSVQKTDLISTIGDDVILSNLDKYESLVHRYNEDEGFSDCDYDPDDSLICFIELRKENRGAQRVSGVDLNASLRDIRTGMGTFGARLSGTWTLSSKQQTGNNDPYVSNLGKFVNDGVVQRWRHNLAVDWESGDFGATVSNSYLSGYEDQNNAIDTNTGLVVGANKVKAYSLWNLSGSWAVTRALTLRGGVQNLFDTAPPYSNQAYFFISGYDPSYTDPRGRFFYLSAQYQFK